MRKSEMHISIINKEKQREYSDSFVKKISSTIPTKNSLRHMVSMDSISLSGLICFNRSFYMLQKN